MDKKDLRFTKDVRLGSASEYANVFKGAARSTDRFFTVLAKRSKRTSARLGLAIAKKSVKKAVKRNLIKRVIRESFRRQKEDLTGLDFVVLCRRDAATASKKALAASIQYHWGKLVSHE
ncbi:MAG TPA: ribonuclease P protein component [Candidatus Thioglobus sp.]|nr:ribonuclease P protein component [Candidatus Thioglobus sp.]